MLDHGHSVTDIEEHLTNTATLVEEQIPTTWSSELKMLKSLDTLIHITTKYTLLVPSQLHLYDKS